MIIKFRNALDQTAQNTFLSQTESLGTTTLHIKSANGFIAQWGIQLGKTGEETSEIAVLSAATPSGTTLALATATVNDHPTDTPVYGIKYDKLIIKRSTTGTAGTAAVFTGSTINIDPTSLYTQFDDTSGATTYAYKATYFNSVIGTTSTDSDWIIPTGYSFYSLGGIRQRIKDKLFSFGFIGDDSVIDNWINEYLEQMTNAAIDVNQDYNIGSTNVVYSGTAELGTITDTDFKQVRRIWITTDGINYYVATKMEVTAFKKDQVFNDSQPYFYMYGDTGIGRYPHDTTGTACILYYKLNPVLVNDTDELPNPMKGYTKGFVDYALAMAKYKDNRANEAQALEASAIAGVDKFKREATPRTKSGVQYIDIVETVTEDTSEFWFRT